MEVVGEIWVARVRGQRGEVELSWGWLIVNLEKKTIL